MPKRPVQFANYVCHFDQLELLDLFDEIVLPSFLNNNVRQFKETKLFFHDVRLINLSTRKNEFEPAICGRLVKDTVVHSHQIYNSGNLIPSKNKMETSPSSIFTLLLKNHKVIYLQEYSNSPNLDTFRSTSFAFLTKTRNNLVKELSKEIKGDDRKDKLQKIEKTYPLPTLEVLTLNSDESLEDFISKFSLLQEVSIKMIKPNNEVNSAKFFNDVRNVSESVGSTNSNLTFRNKEGLTKDSTLNQIKPALDGNSKVSFKGKDKNENKLSGTNEDFKLTKFMQVIMGNTIENARAMLDLFEDATKDGLIKIPNHTAKEEKLAKVKKSMNSHKK